MSPISYLMALEMGQGAFPSIFWWRFQNKLDILLIEAGGVFL